MLPSKFAFVDIETTGARSYYDNIIEIGILRVEDDVITKTFHSLVNPDRYLPPEITSLTGIQEHQLQKAPSFRSIADEVLEILQDNVFVAHNARFDYSFIKNSFSREQKSFNARNLCTVKLSRLLYPQFAKHNLDSIIERFGFTCENRHRAFDDATILQKFFSVTKERFPLEVFEKALATVMKKPSLPINLKQTDLDALPELPGVYLFYGIDDVPLYIGKSINIKDRVLSHFSGDLHSSTEMNISQQIQRIETIVTAGELGALITESHLIKKMLPIYNKKLRLKRELIALKKHIDKNGYMTIQQEVIQTIDHTNLESYIGFFRSKKQAKEYLYRCAKEHTLCERLLGLEKTNTSCFAYRLGNCNGGCIGKEISLRYNMRFIEAFSSMKILPWPFPGTIAIDEVNPLSGKKETFLIDKWCYLGSIKHDTNGAENTELENELQFDLDLYKILRGYLRSEKNTKRIKLARIPEYNKDDLYSATVPH